jgi:hypothetical protein
MAALIITRSVQHQPGVYNGRNIISLGAHSFQENGLVVNSTGRTCVRRLAVVMRAHHDPNDRLGYSERPGFAHEGGCARFSLPHLIASSHLVRMICFFEDWGLHFAIRTHTPLLLPTQVIKRLLWTLGCLTKAHLRNPLKLRLHPR